MTLDDIIATLRERDGALVVSSGTLRYVGPVPLAADDPLRAGIAEHRAVLIEMFTYAPGGRCVFPACYRLLTPGDKIACPDHRREIDATPAPWERAAPVGSGAA